MAPTVLDIKRNIVQLAQIKGLKQDCVTEDYSKVKMWLGKGDYTEKYPMPKTVKEYLEWIRIQLEFVKQRNARIQTFSEKTMEMRAR